jgi:hypothetical protein
MVDAVAQDPHELGGQSLTRSGVDDPDSWLGIGQGTA